MTNSVAANGLFTPRVVQKRKRRSRPVVGCRWDLFDQQIPALRPDVEGSGLGQRQAILSSRQVSLSGGVSSS